MDESELYLHWSDICSLAMANGRMQRFSQKNYTLQYTIYQKAFLWGQRFKKSKHKQQSDD